MKYLLRNILYNLGRIISAVFNSGVRLKYVLALLIIVAGGSVALTYSRMMSNVGGKDDYSESMRYVELKKLIQDKFIDTVDSSSMTDSASSAIVAGLGDKWSYYMSPDEYNSYQLYSSNEYSDIGMSIMKNKNGGFNIISVTPGSAAGTAGLQSGMAITAIAGQDVSAMDIDAVRQLIRSNINEPFAINIGKDSYTVDCTTSYSTSVLYRLEKTEAGYIQILNFEAGSGDTAIAAIEDLLANKCVALCIDLRNNPGGLSSEMSKLLDYLLPNGDLFGLVDKEGKKDVIKSDAMSLQLPTVILVNSETYAEAEVFAAVMQEYRWATIIGEATPGMTRIQETFPLGDGSAVRLSTKSYVTANGTDIALAGGVIPETIIHNSDPSTVGTTLGTTGDSVGTASSSEDEQLMAALKLLS